MENSEVSPDLLKFELEKAVAEMRFWSKFPEDLIFKIIYGLKIKDLVALTFVSKEWNFVISKFCIPRLCPPSPYAPFWGFLCFKDPLPPISEKDGDHNNNSDPSSEEDKYLKLYFRTIYGMSYPPGVCRPNVEDYFLPLLPEEHDASNIRDCCNGLLLLASSKNSQYYVANPVTKQRLLLPNNSHHHCNTKTIHSSLVYDPSLARGFKIVSCIRPAEDATVTHPMELDIFCSDTGQWSEHVLLLEPCSLYGFEWLRRSVYFNGALFSLSLAMYLVCIDNLIPRPGWNTTSSSISKDHSGFDVKAWAIELPDKDFIPNELLPAGCGCIGVSSGCLYYSNRDAQGSSMFVWKLVSKGKNSEWVLIHTINIAYDLEVNNVGGRNLVGHWKNSDYFRPRAFLPTDDTIIIASPQLFITYQLKTKLVDRFWRPEHRWPCNRKTLQLDGNWIFPFSPCPLLLKTTAAENSIEY